MKKSKSSKKQKYQDMSHVVTSADPAITRDLYAETDQDSPLGARQLAAGYIQHPDTGMYQIWLSTNGLDVTCLAAHRDVGRADRAVEDLKAFARTPMIYDEEKCAAFFATLEQLGDGKPQPLPDDLVRQIARGILRRVVDTPKKEQ